MKRALLLGLLALSACARPLTETETLVAKNLFGESLDTEAVTVTAGVGVLPLPRKPRPEPAAAGDPQPTRKPPDDLCVRKPNPRQYWDWPAAFVLRNTLFFSFKWYPHDAFDGMPETVPYPHSVLMAHELVHVWQWQNRDWTGYAPLKAGNESLVSRDPYFFDPAEAGEFLSFGYEQQAAMIEDFVCYALFDPDDPKLDEIAGILRPVLPVDGFLKSLGR